MTRSMTTGAAAALALLAVPATTWAAEPAPPPPTSLDQAGVLAWLNKYIKADGWTVLAADQGAVAMSAPSGTKVLADATLQTEIREEYFKPMDFGAMRSRSTLQVWNVDCQADRMRVLAVRLYEGNNLQGAHVERENLKAPWTPIEPGSAPALTADRLCETGAAGAGLAPGTPGR